MRIVERECETTREIPIQQGRHGGPGTSGRVLPSEQHIRLCWTSHGERTGSIVRASWSSGMKVNPLSQRGLHILAFEGASQAIVRLQFSGPPKCGLLLDRRGGVSVEDSTGAFSIPEGQMELRLCQEPLSLRTEPDARAVLVIIPQERLRQAGKGLLKRVFGQDQLGKRSSLSLTVVSLASRLLTDCLEDLGEQIQAGGSVAQSRRSGDLIIALLNEVLADQQPVAGVEAKQRTPWYVAAVEKRMTANMAQQLSVGELARLTGVSPRTLHDGFRRHRGVSPMKLLREQRMEMVRRDLCEPAENTSVTDAALTWGFNHLGRFSSYYLARYGEKPSDTLRRARGNPCERSAAVLEARAS